MSGEAPIKAGLESLGPEGRLRFWRKVRIPYNRNLCWEWTAAKDPSGYGRFGIQGKATRLAHHVSYYLYNGVDPRGSVVRHSCDNTSCVNPRHLTLGTHADNVRDKVAKGRQAGQGATGENHGRTRLTDEQANAVRCLLDSGFSINALARIFRVSVNPILAIRNATRPVSTTINWKAHK